MTRTPRTTSGATLEALRPRPRIRPRRGMEYWSVGVLRFLPIAPRDREVGATFRAHALTTSNPGLKPWAKFYNRFAVSF